VRSGWISSLGAFIARFETEFAAFCGAPHAVAVSNGTAAMHLALAAAGIGPGDEVLVPTLTFVATANAVRYTGATPVFVDAESATWQMDPRDLAARVTPRARAIVPVHLYGHPCDMDPILATAKRHGLVVIEDAAEAHGARCRGRRVGALGDVGCFSFYGNKIITTGEGGMCVTDDAALADRLRLFRDHGMDPKRSYWHEVIGFNYRMTNLQAAVGVAQTRKMLGFIEKKRQIARWYAVCLAPLARAGRLRLHPEAAWARNVYWMYSVILGEASPTLDVVRSRLADRGVDSRPFFHPIHTLPPYATGQRLPVAEQLASHGLNLPSGVGLTQAEVERVAQALFQALES
jgi:perosamine synthetase